jgi:hypothetical protein
MYIDALAIVETKRRERLFEIGEDSRGHTKIPAPPKGCAGLYFFYTSYTLAEMEQATHIVTGQAVPIAKLVRAHQRLQGVCQIVHDGFRLVYNGVGGYTGGEYDLRTRILQEISAVDPRTGSLCIRQSTVNDLARWRYSFVTLGSSSAPENSDLGTAWPYEEHALDIERCWRLQYGWPLLCRH